MVFSHVWMWELDHKEGWAPKNWCFQVVLEKSLESPLHFKEIKSVYPKGNQPWFPIFIGRTDDEAPILWPHDAKSQLLGKDWCWKRLKAIRERGSREWVGYITSPTQWTWMWTNSERQYWTRGVWLAVVHGVTESRIQLIDRTTTADSCEYKLMKRNWTSAKLWSIPCATPII